MLGPIPGFSKCHPLSWLAGNGIHFYIHSFTYTFFQLVVFFFIKMTFYLCDNNKVFNIITLITFKYLYIMVNLHFEVTGILTSQVV